ncbi:hypothetical protein ACRYCC_13025 [Actinomadura scrupuli]|uniref:hypothetical protein n=1 Tax=Actinomadura scrupuli TaxID=559629 RepID=UPI003D952AE8
MPADPSAIAAHATTLHTDSGSLAACAARLGDIARGLAETAAAPAWLEDVLHGHVTRCLAASADLATAAARLEEHGRAVALPPAP